MANQSVQEGAGELVTLGQWKALSDSVRAANPGKERGLCVWHHELVLALSKQGYSLTKKDGTALEGASLTRFLNGARKMLKLNMLKSGLNAVDAEEKTKIGGSNFIKIEELREMDISGF